ncbi:MAG TPA: GNAT family N-acetyltransferase [Candidatus Dormibacteraeota bacterium]|nr:GNAT family N-acetyltransferase [Candidatus Dormibacteraeota bacterium]
MSKPGFDLALRPATLDDAAIVADLETARNPDDPRDPVMLRFWWSTRSPDDKAHELISERDGAAIAFVGAGHEPWKDKPKRFGWVRASLHPEVWTALRFEQAVGLAEDWLRDVGGAIAVVRRYGNQTDEIGVLERRGYKEVRRQKHQHLDLVEHREALLAAAEQSRVQMREQGVALLTLDHDDDPERMTKLYELTMATWHDIPTTVPIHLPPYEEWLRIFFDNPSVRKDRFWIARVDDAIVGLSFISHPPIRGLPWTNYTATSKGVRGRGIARAMKYESLAQAIALGHQRVGTSNDGENAPILHLNAELGYRPAVPEIELHRELGP